MVDNHSLTTVKITSNQLKNKRVEIEYLMSLARSFSKFSTVKVAPSWQQNTLCCFINYCVEYCQVAIKGSIVETFDLRIYEFNLDAIALKTGFNQKWG